MKSRHLLIASAVALGYRQAGGDVHLAAAFPLGVDAVRLQRVVNSMKRFGLLPKNTDFQITSLIG